MSCAIPARPPKRRRDEMDEKIEVLSKVINNMTGSKKSILQAKLHNIKLKAQKLIALSLCRSQEPSRQNLMTEYDMMIAENDIDIEIESIRSSKKFKRTENRYLERLFRDSYSTENRAHNSAPNDASTSYSSADVSNIHSKENTPPHEQNISKTLKTVPMCHKSTNTNPAVIITVPNEKEMELYLRKDMSLTSISPPEGSLSQVIESTSRNENESIQDNFPHIVDFALLINNEQDLIQSKWFESSFENENSTNQQDKHGISSQQSEIGNLTNCNTPKITETEYKHKRKYRKSKENNKTNVNTLVEQSNQIITKQNFNENMKNTTNTKLSEATVPLPKPNMPLQKATVPLQEVTMPLPQATVQLQKATLPLPKPSVQLLEVTAPSPKATVPLQKVTMPLSNATVQSQETTVPSPIDIGSLSKAYVPSSKPTMPLQKVIASLPTTAWPESTLEEVPKESKMALENIAKPSTVLPEATVLPETNHSHRHISNLFKTYKKIYSPEQDNTNSIKTTHSVQNSANYGNDEKLLATNDLKRAVKSDDNFIVKTDKENDQNSKEILQQSVELSTKIDKKSKCINNLQRKSKDLSTKSRNSSVKYEDWFYKSQNLYTKSKDLSPKSLDLPTKSKDVSSYAKRLDVATKYKNMHSNAKHQYVSTKSKDLYTKSLDLSTKSKDTHSYAKYQEVSTKSKDSYTNSLDLCTKSKDRHSYAKYQEVSTKSKDSYTKSQETSFKSISHETDRLINGLFTDLMASKRYQPQTDSSSDKTVSCHDCGLVSEGHMCVWTIREILEQC